MASLSGDLSRYSYLVQTHEHHAVSNLASYTFKLNQLLPDVIDVAGSPRCQASFNAARILAESAPQGGERRLDKARAVAESHFP